jgi:hypothetical protein
MADIRNCEQCGTSFVPRREHARFCSARCRAAWNREHMGDLKAGASALRWSITAMIDTTERLPKARAGDLRFPGGPPGTEIRRGEVPQLSDLPVTLLIATGVVKAPR